MLQRISRKAFLFLLFWLTVQDGFAQEKVKEELRKKVQKAALGLIVSPPDLRSPVSVNAGAVWSDDKKQLAVILKAEVLDGWHIYAHVPADQPYIQSELRQTVPKELLPLGTWETPALYPYDGGIFIYKGSLVFIRYFSVKKGVENKMVEVGLYYQTCDIQQCLPPELAAVKVAL